MAWQVMTSYDGARTGLLLEKALQEVNDLKSKSKKLKFIYAVADGGVVGFTINQNTGFLTQIAGSPFPTGTNTRFAKKSAKLFDFWAWKNIELRLKNKTPKMPEAIITSISPKPF